MKKAILLMLIISASFLATNAQYTKLFDFDGSTSGQNPLGFLLYDGTYMYGLTQTGGANNFGTAFKIKPDGTGYVNLHDFAVATGSYPCGSLVSDGTYLYGTTEIGGANSDGTIFKILPNGTGYADVLSFAGATNGRVPVSSLIYDGTYLYGMTFGGGTNDYGVVFRIKPDGSGYSKYLDFAGAANGKNPNGSLYFDGTNLWGMTQTGGGSNMGTIFGNGFSELLFFSGTTNGRNPQGTLISDGTYLYGTTEIGGANNLGVVFKIMPDGSGFVKLLDFDGASKGSHPFGDLLLVGSNLYGMTEQGGANDYGTVFKMDTDGTGFVDLFDFAGTISGSNPYGSLISINNVLYGMTNKGGANNLGTIFKLCIPVTVTQSPTICAGQSVTVGNSTYTISGTYSDTLTAVNTCDSIITTYLTVLPPDTFARSLAICQGLSITVGIHTYSNTGNYSDTLISLVNGCDSIINTNLTVLAPDTFTQSPFVCAGQSITVGSHTYTITGTYSDTLSSILSGCDSIVTTHLNMLPLDTFSQWPTVCAGQSIMVGSHTYTISGTYSDTLISLINGCDSIITTHLTINSAIDTSVVIHGNTITANATNATFQWIDCNNGDNVIQGETNPSYTADVDGNYAVIITQYSCSDTSVCYNIITEGIVETASAMTITIYPNPNEGIFQLQIGGGSSSYNQYQIEIYNVMGEKIYSTNGDKKQALYNIDISGSPKGIYFVKIYEHDRIHIEKIVIN